MVGEGGLSPDYFLHRMTVTETESFLRGQDRRYRQQWEQTRLLAGTVVKLLTGENIELEYPWDGECANAAEGPSQEELDALRARARMLEQKFNVGNL